MQPCSQPRYGLILNSKPTSGLLFRAMIFFVVSRKTIVGGGGSSGSYASMSGTYSIGSNRLAGFSAAPRTLIVTRFCASIVLILLLRPGIAAENAKKVEPYFAIDYGARTSFFSFFLIKTKSLYPPSTRSPRQFSSDPHCDSWLCISLA